MLRQLELEQIRAGDHTAPGYGPNNAYTWLAINFFPGAGRSSRRTYDYNQFEYLQREDKRYQAGSWRMTTSVIRQRRTGIFLDADTSTAVVAPRVFSSGYPYTPKQ